MCGIVGTAGNHYQTEKNIFLELLHADVVRGKHATGLIQVKGKCRTVNNFKLAYPAPIFLDLPIVQQELVGFLQNTVSIGHNRHATKGAATEHKNAHPFEHGHISMVHNGSLTSWGDLTPTGENYTVDSEAICRSLELNDPETVIKKLKGAFTLVWVDSNTDTLNFVRNSQRPMAIAMNTKTNKMYWASEMDMLVWSLNRDTFTRSPIDYDEIFELPVGQWLSVPITNVGIDLSKLEMKEVELYTAPATTYGYNRRSASSTSSTSTTTTAAKEKVTEYSFGPTKEEELKAATAKVINAKGKDNDVIREFIGLIDIDPGAMLLDERVGTFLTEWKPYQDGSQHGQAQGISMDYPYCNTIVHGVTQKEFDETVRLTNGMISSYIVGFEAPKDLKADQDFDDDKMGEFSVILSKMNLRKAKLDDYEWQMDQVPKDTAANLKKDEKVVHLKDDSVVAEGGTAVFLGSKIGVPSNHRYTISYIKKINNIVNLFVTLGTVTYNMPWDDFAQGTMGSK